LKQLICFKVIVFLNFLQTMIFSFLTSGGDLHPSKYLTYNDLTNGLPPLILCCEMAVIAPVFYYAFPISPYKLGNGLLYESGARVEDNRVYQGGPVGIFALLKALNVFDMITTVFSKGLTNSNHEDFAPIYEESQSYVPSQIYEQPQPMQDMGRSRRGRRSRYANERY
jgi:hypothetical protein